MPSSAPDALLSAEHTLVGLLFPEQAVNSCVIVDHVQVALLATQTHEQTAKASVDSHHVAALVVVLEHLAVHAVVVTVQERRL